MPWSRNLETSFFAEALAKKAAVDASSATTVNPDAPNVLQAMMKLEQANARAKTTNKVSLETEKEKDADEKTVEELKRQLQPKRARTMMMLVMLMKSSQKLIIGT